MSSNEDVGAKIMELEEALEGMVREDGGPPDGVDEPVEFGGTVSSQAYAEYRGEAFETWKDFLGFEEDTRRHRDAAQLVNNAAIRYSKNGAYPTEEAAKNFLRFVSEVYLSMHAPRFMDTVILNGFTGDVEAVFIEEGEEKGVYVDSSLEALRIKTFATDTTIEADRADDILSDEESRHDIAALVARDIDQRIIGDLPPDDMPGSCEPTKESLMDCLRAVRGEAGGFNGGVFRSAPNRIAVPDGVAGNLDLSDGDVLFGGDEGIEVCVIPDACAEDTIFLNRCRIKEAGELPLLMGPIAALHEINRTPTFLDPDNRTYRQGFRVRYTVRGGPQNQLMRIKVRS